MFGNSVPKGQSFGSRYQDMEAVKETIEGQLGRKHWTLTLDPQYPCPLSDEFDRCQDLTHPAILVANGQQQSHPADESKALLYWHYSPETELAAFHLHSANMTVEDFPMLAYDSFTGLGPEQGQQVLAQEFTRRVLDFFQET